MIIVSLAIMIFILTKKIPMAASVDIEKIPEEAQDLVKKDLIERKIDRKLNVLIEKIKPLSEKISRSFGEQFKNFKKRIINLEHKYKEKDKGLVKNSASLKQNIKTLLEEADCLAKEESPEKAEKKYLEVIGLDNRNIIAYAGLGNIYYKKGEFIGAREAMEYVVKLAENGYGELEATDFVLLSLIYKSLNDFKNAFKSIKKAIKLEPNNPKNLDLLCKISIINRDKKEAKDACDKLESVNPDNESINEFRKEIGKIRN